MGKRAWLLVDLYAITGILVLAWNLIIAQLYSTLVGTNIITIHLNRVGEQVVEAIIFPIAGLLGILALVRAFRRWKYYDKRRL